MAAAVHTTLALAAMEIVQVLARIFLLVVVMEPIDKINTQVVLVEVDQAET